MAARLIDVPATLENGNSFEDIAASPSEAAFANDIRTHAIEHYGHAGPMFVREFSNDPEGHMAIAKKHIERFVEHFVRPEHDPIVGRIAQRFGLAYAAGMLAVSFGIVPWNKSSVFKAASSCFNGWLENRGTTVSEDRHNALRQVVSFFDLHGNSRFETLSSSGSEATLDIRDPRTIHNRCGLKGTKDDGTVIYYVFPTILENEICKGFDPNFVARALKESGTLMTNEKKRFQIKKKTHGYSDNARYYTIDAPKLPQF